jgi:hypothetical protein
MRLLIIRCGVGIVVLGVVWLFAAHWISLAIDQVFKVQVDSASASPVGWNGVFLQFGSQIQDLEGPGPGYRKVAAASIDANNRLVVSVNGRSFVLGPRAGDLPAGGTPPTTIAAYAAEPGDVSSLTTERSLLSWPVFELNFMTGQSPTWRRDVYSHLSWKKPSGERLDLVWRFEQAFYPGDGWTSPSGTEDGLTGVISANIQPASPAGR